MWSQSATAGAARRARWLGFVALTVAADAAAEVRLSVAAFRRVAPDLGAEWRVRVGLTVPLGGMAGAAPPLAQHAEAAPEEGSAPPAAEPPSPAARLPAPATSPVPRHGAAPRLRSDLARGAIEAVLRAQGDGRTRGRLASLAARANTSAWLPELRLAGGRATDQSLRLNATADDPSRYVQSGGSDLWGEVRLTWRLNRLVFSSDELSIERLREQSTEARMKLVARVLQTLATWHRAGLRAADPTLLPDEQVTAELDLLEAELWLDVMSDGWFGRRIRREARRAQKP